MKFITSIVVPACLLAFAGCDPGDEPDDRTAAGEYTVTAPELAIHASTAGEPLGRLYRGEVMDVHHIDEDGWAFGFAGGTVQRCVWAKFRDTLPNTNAIVFNFNEDAPGQHDGGCETVEDDDAPDPSEWSSRVSADGEQGTPILTDCDRSAYWKNWDWDAGAGVGTEDGILDRDTEVHWRYVTSDGNGVMASLADDSWVFIARPCMPL